MPRIAATLGVFGLVVLALGLNMAQFPIEYGSPMPMAGSPKSEAKPNTAPFRSERESVVTCEEADAGAAPARSEQKVVENVAKQQEPSASSAATPYPLPTASLPPVDDAGTFDPAGSPSFPSFMTQSDGGKDTQDEPGQQRDRRQSQKREVAHDFHATPEPEPEAAAPVTAAPATTEPEPAVVPEYTSAIPDTAEQPATRFSTADAAGIYNPLEPRHDVGSEIPTTATPARPEPESDPNVPAEVLSNPAYAADSGLGLRGNDLVPVEVTPEAVPSRNGVIRLPPTDDAPPIDSSPAINDTPEINNPSPNKELQSNDSKWPGEPATQSLPLRWYPSEGYTKPEGLR